MYTILSWESTGIGNMNKKHIENARKKKKIMNVSLCYHKMNKISISSKELKYRLNVSFFKLFGENYT
jgi:hypothetical protein